MRIDCQSQHHAGLLSPGAKLVLRLLSVLFMGTAHLSQEANANNRGVSISSSTEHRRLRSLINLMNFLSALYFSFFIFSLSAALSGDWRTPRPVLLLLFSSAGSVFSVLLSPDDWQNLALTTDQLDEGMKQTEELLDLSVVLWEPKVTSLGQTLRPECEQRDWGRREGRGSRKSH